MKRLEGRIALITGASRGIGRAVAQTFASEGAALALIARNNAALEEVSAACRAGGSPRVMIRAVDISDAKACEDTVKAVAAEFGGLDILVNNAGVTRDNLMLRMKDEDWDIVLAVNLRSAFVLTRTAARFLMKSQYGRVINMASVIGLTGNTGQANYAASKGGLIALTKSVAKEFASRGVTANAIAPGMIDTDMTAELADEVKAAILKQIPLGRYGGGEDIARAALYLASDDGAYMTGQVLVVDGGMVM